MTAPWCSPLINERSIHYSICRGMTNKPQRDKQGLHVGKHTCRMHELVNWSLVSAWLCWIKGISTHSLLHVDGRSLITTAEIISVWGRGKGVYVCVEGYLSICGVRALIQTRCACAFWKCNTPKPMCLLNNQAIMLADKTTTFRLTSWTTCMRIVWR